MESIEAIKVDTATVARLKRAGGRSRRKEYWFFLTDHEVAAAAPLGDAAVMAYAVIRAASWGPRRGDWVKPTPTALAAFSRGPRWWHAATTRLADAKLIEVHRARGRQPRYRMLVDKTPDPAGAASRETSFG